jgi:hypothetical protein
MMSNKTYSILNNLIIFYIPVFGVMCYIIGAFLDVRQGVIAGLLVILLLIIVILGIFREGKAFHDGQIVITTTSEGMKTFTLELDKEPSEIENLSSITFKVTGEQSIGYEDPN